ncbi:phosphoribosylanthranilate isomerase [bacterium]|nr:phosphoribosylanthranilate isomerase [bacterium]
MTRVKICGITRLDDALVACEIGADMIGFILAQSPRRVSPKQVARIVSALPNTVRKIGVFVHHSALDASEIARDCGLDTIQLHGTPAIDAVDSSPEIIQAFAGATSADDIIASTADFVLLDGCRAGLHGGTGQRCDWSLAARIASQRDLILAGGLTPDNVAQALSHVRPYAVDVSSGVEFAPGHKDIQKTKRFIAEVHSWDCRTNAAISDVSGDGLSPRH